MTLDTREQANGFSQAFQSLFFSTNSIFRRRSSHDQESFKASSNSYNGMHIEPSPAVVSNHHHTLPVITSGGEDGCEMFSLSNTVDEKESACSPYCTLSPLPISRSDSSITVDSNVSSVNDYVTPTFSPLQSSIDDYDDISEPWRLTRINKGNIEENYFFMDRDDGDCLSVNEYSER
ncbi:hypothetical protein K501DRAFT_32018 [Backusella circina FSU 941]|nr:hypothetical protein K501DRAFT_32018 [Backusella circina FSU 941]